jgi:hypothetical protein
VTLQLAALLFAAGLLAFYVLGNVLASALWGAVARWRGR